MAEHDPSHPDHDSEHCPVCIYERAYPVRPDQSLVDVLDALGLHHAPTGYGSEHRVWRVDDEGEETMFCGTAGYAWEWLRQRWLIR